MFRLKLVVVILVLSALLFSCSGKDGATGPAGKTGKDGNANVIVFQYGTATTTAGILTYVFNASQGLVDSCLVLGYANPSDQAATAWYPVPGLGSNGNYMTRSFHYQTVVSPSEYSYIVRLLTPSGSANYTTSTTFTRFKIILAPASEINEITSRGLLDLSDYNAVAEYLNLSE
jgi:hypothetical protein